MTLWALNLNWICYRTKWQLHSSNFHSWLLAYVFWCQQRSPWLELPTPVQFGGHVWTDDPVFDSKVQAAWTEKTKSQRVIFFWYKHYRTFASLVHKFGIPNRLLWSHLPSFIDGKRIERGRLFLNLSLERNEILKD